MKGYVITNGRMPVSVVPTCEMDWKFVALNRHCIRFEQDSLPDEDEIEFRIRMANIAESFRKSLND